MAITEATRHQLHQRLEAVLGPEEAAILMELVPPVGWADVATKRDLDHLETTLRQELELRLLALETSLRQALHSEIHGLRSELHTEIGGLRSELHAEIGGLRSELHAEIGALRSELHTEIGALRSELHTEIGGLRDDLHRTFRDQLRWSVATQVALLSVFFAAMKLL